MMNIYLRGPDGVYGKKVNMVSVPRKGDYLLIDEVEYRVEKVVWPVNFSDVAILVLLPEGE